MLTGQNVREIVKCKSCSKPRCLYSSANLSNRDQRDLTKIMRMYKYVGGCLITPDVSYLYGTLFTWLGMHCKSPIEWAYYSASKANTRKDVCCHCSKMVLKLIRMRRSYTKASLLCTINLKHRERKS